MHDTQEGPQGVSRVVSMASLPVCSLWWWGAVQLTPPLREAIPVGTQY
jgi:hypothetical protein